MNNSYRTYTIIAALVVILVGGVWWEKRNSSQIPAPAEIATTSTDSTSSPQVATSSEPVVVAPSTVQQKPKQPAETPKPFVFALVQGDTLASWNFVGSYKDGGVLEAKVRVAIERSKGLLNSGKFTNYELYVSIANQYDLLGDGAHEYEYLNKALSIDSTKTGLAWHNMGKLLERLGAYKTARVAYDRLISAQPTSQYIRARLEFLQVHMPEDTDAIKQAETDLSASTW